MRGIAVASRQGFVVSSRTRSLELGAAGGKEGNSDWKLRT